ncbi:AAA domain-containing protein [Luedemannella helvata]|uniref:AAA+ ATPase domain-containing protein n=1 Tax=Luedemannella helvata TaxID=349315 RepID=A0ABN2K0A9_9ACTN
MPSTRSRDRELVATTSNLVEFLRDVAQARRRRVLDVGEYETVLWLADLPAEVVLDRDAGAGEALFAVPRVRAEAAPPLPAELRGWVDEAAAKDANGAEPRLTPPTGSRSEAGSAGDAAAGTAALVAPTPRQGLPVVPARQDAAPAADGTTAPGHPTVVTDATVLDRAGARAVGTASVDATLILPRVPDEEPRVPQAVLDAYGRWLPEWLAWAARDRATTTIRQWYQALASAAHLLSQQEDQYEAVLGTGLLTWSGGGVSVRNHILATRVRIVVDAERDEARVVLDAEATTRVQDRELLDGVAQFHPPRVETVHEQVREGAFVAPLTDAENLMKIWAERALDDATPFDATWSPSTAKDQAGVRLAPAIVLRRRERASLIGYYDAMLQALSGPQAQSPLGLAQLVTSMEANERLEWLRDKGDDPEATRVLDADGVPDVRPDVLGVDPLFPLPANPEQLRIMERLQTNNGVVVQGPPGTGKTHTIANLISALLADGQRVLVTSQKPQALRVLRDKLPPEVAKLCVSVTDLGGAGSAELEGSVKAMANRYAGFDPQAHQLQEDRAAQRRADLIERVDRLTDDIRVLREAELTRHPEVAPGYAGTLGEIAQRLRRDAVRHDWMPVPAAAAIDLETTLVLDEPVTATAWQPPALTVTEAAELLRLLAAQTPRRVARRRQRLVDVSTYPVGDEVRAMMAAEAAAYEAAARESTEVSRQLDGCDAATLQALKAAVDNARRASADLGLDADVTAWPAQDWAVRAIADGLAGRDATVWGQLAAGRERIADAERAIATIGFREVAIAPAAPGTAAARFELVAKLRDHLAAGNKLRGGLLKPGVQRDAEDVLDHATVDGAPIDTAERVYVVAAALQAQATVEALARGWAMVGVPFGGQDAGRPGGPGHGGGEPIQRQVARLVETYHRLAHVQRFLAAVGDVRRALEAARAWLPLTDLGDWWELVDALDAVRLRVEAEQATARLGALAERMTLDARGGGAPVGTAPAAGPGEAPPELVRAANALVGRDADAYAQALAELSLAPGERADQLACDALLARLEAAHPALAAAMAAAPADPAWPGRLSGWDAAWAWAAAAAFFQQQRQPGREQELEAELADAVTRLRQETATLAALRAWGHCLRRMTAHQAQALQAYEQHMRAVGKGTGRYAARYRSRAREAMREARDAVPAWVMPLDLVLETLPPVRDSFDVVIVDEASQASLEDLFLLWLAPRVIVVGDDKQCAPSQVRLGELEPIFGKLHSYLPDLPGYLRDAFTPKSSLFDLLRTRFGAVIPLREHFRCMPEIIEYSSRQFYADEPLVPLRQFGGDRLPPLRAVFVPGAQTEGTATRLRNPVEAEAIVAQIEACVADPAYAGKSIGVVVLQGTGQVQLIHSLLLERLEPKEWEDRRLRVGTPPDFQGDERDVVFLSLVIAEKRQALTGTEWQRRFNVAASRAKDQAWLFHSVGLADLSLADLRHSLLSYVLNPPPALGGPVLADVTADEPHPAFGSLIEQQVFLQIRARGYHVTPQVEVNGRYVDLVVTGARGRLAVEVDGAHWTGTPEQREADLDRERELKRAGWRFWRVRESEFRYDPQAALAGLWETLDRLDIRPFDAADAAPATTATVWEPAPLSTVEGVDGLESGNPDELDDVRLVTTRVL